jgi:predicted alpha/beta superfamily hydrolase
MKNPTVRHPPVSIANSELRNLQSSINGQGYQVRVRLPEDYAATKASYPVLYLLDGDHAFAMATDVVQYLIYGRHIPDLLIVSTAYGSKKGFDEGGRNMRDRDLVPFRLPNKNIMPGGGQYLEFLQQELIPFVESNYRVLRNDRTLWGYSLGGIFALYALFQKPYLFKRYIIVDGFNEKHMEMEESYAAHHTDLPVRMFISAPPGEWGDGLSKLSAKLKSRNYPHFQSEYASLNDIGHFAVPAEGLTRGLVSVFENSAIMNIC